MKISVTCITKSKNFGFGDYYRIKISVCEKRPGKILVNVLTKVSFGKCTESNLRSLRGSNGSSYYCS